jgi:HAMP domain-containing protein
MKIKTAFRSGVFRRLLLSSLLVSLLPLVVLGAFTLHSIRNAGEEAIALSRVALDEKSAEALEVRTVETARAVARFLEDREADLRALALLPRSPEAYLAFSQAHQGELWHLHEGVETRHSVDLYREIAYVDASGRERVKIAGGQIVGPVNLRDVSDPSQTLYRSETYFAEASRLAPGEIYVSPVTGFYVNQAAFQAGQRFEGVLRFAMPVFDGRGDFDGIVVLALDSRHLEEFTTHIVPTEERFVLEPDADTGNYAYIIDHEARVVAHPVDFLQWGVDEEGRRLPYATSQEDLGVYPVLLDRLEFVDAELSAIHSRAVRGEAGSVQYFWAGHHKFASYVPIPYYGGSYQPPAGFGWVAITADADAFHESARLVGRAISERTRSLVAAGISIVVVTALAVLLIAGLLARTVASPIQRLTQAARAVQQGDFRLDSLDRLLEGRPKEDKDEIVNLARVFRQMASRVQERELELREQVRSLRIEIDETKRARQVAQITETEEFRRLREQARAFRQRRDEADPEIEEET